MKKLASLLIADAVNAQLCTGDWYHGYETNSVQYTAIALGFKQSNMILGGTYKKTPTQNCAFVEYFSQNTNTTPTEVQTNCDYIFKLDDLTSGPCSSVSDSDKQCECVGGVLDGGQNCRILTTGVQALTLKIDDTQSSSVFGVFTTNVKLLVFFIIRDLDGAFNSKEFSIKDYDYGFCLAPALANNQLLFTTTDGKDQMTAIFDDCTANLAYNYIGTFTKQSDVKSVAYFNTPAVKWSAVSSTLYDTFSSQFAGMQVNGSVKSVVVLQSQNNQSATQVSSPTCILEFMKLDTTFQTNFGHLDYTIAGAVSVQTNKGFVVVLHSTTTPSPVVVGVSNTGGAGSGSLCTNQASLQKIQSATPLGLQVQEVQNVNGDENSVIILMKDQTGDDFHIFQWEVISLDIQQTKKITHTYAVTISLSDAILVNIYYKIDRKNTQRVAMLGKNNFGAAQNYGFLVRQPLTAAKTCLTLALVDESMTIQQVGAPYTATPLSNGISKEPDQDSGSTFNEATLGDLAKNPCLLSVSLQTNPNPTSESVCKAGEINTLELGPTVQQTCPFDSQPAPPFQATNFKITDAHSTATTSDFIQLVSNSQLQCSATSPTPACFTVSFQFQLTGYLYPTTYISFPYTVDQMKPAAPMAPTTSLNTSNDVTFKWYAPNNCGSLITAYKVQIRQGDGVTYSTETVNCDGSNPAIVAATSCTVPISVLMTAPFNLAQGASVYAKISAINTEGPSDDSPEGNGAKIPLVPSQQSAPSTLVNSSNGVVIAWTAPNDGGSPITSYKLQIKQSNGSFSTELLNCNGADAAIVTATKCTVPVSILMAAPFSLTWGSSVYAKVLATNIRGNSPESLAGNGAKLITVPDAPLLLTINSALTTATTIGLTWNQGFANGGTAVIDYRVSWDQGTGNFIALDSSIIPTQYSTTATLNANTSYKFKVQARNSAGYSLYSNEVAYTTPKVTVLDCDPTKMTVQVIFPLGDQTVIPVHTNEEFQVSWQDFLLIQNAGCTASIKYEVDIQSISGSVETSWFQTDLVLRKIIFRTQASFTDSKLRIKITGRINGISNLASGVDQFLYIVLNKVQNNNLNTLVYEEKRSVEQIVQSWKPPAQKASAQKELVPLTAKIQSISSNGQVRVGFSKLIMIPDYFRNLAARLKAGNYTEIIQNIISVKVDPYTQSKNNTLYMIKSLNVTDFTSSHIDLNVTFAWPNSITTSVMNPDVLDLQILNSQFFVDIVDLVRVTNDTFLTKELPSQLTVKQHVVVEKIEATITTGFTVLAGTNLALNIFLVGALKFLWGLVNILQFLVFMQRWKLDYPANTNSVLKFIKMIALMEFMSTGWFTDILSDWFGIQKGDDQNIVENMGMMLLIGCCVLFAVLLILVVGLLMLFNFKLYRIFRNLLRRVFYNTFIRYLLQSTLKLQIASLITITLTEWDKGKMQILIAGSVVGVLTLFPFIAIWILVKHFKSLSKLSMADKIGSFYLGLKSDKRWAAIAFSPIFLFRRLLFVAITFVLAEQPNLQIHFFMQLLLWYVIYIETVEPHETKFQTTQETVNEIFLLFTCYHFVLFTGLVPDFEMRENIGWSCIGSICAMVGFNVLALLSIGIKTLMRKFKLWKLKRQQKIAIKLRHEAKLEAEKQKMPKPSQLNPTKQTTVTIQKLKPNAQLEFTASEPSIVRSHKKQKTNAVTEESKSFQLFDLPKQKSLIDAKVKNFSMGQALQLKSTVEPKRPRQISESQKSPSFNPRDKYLPQVFDMPPREVAKIILQEKRLGLPSSLLNRPQVTQEQMNKILQQNLHKNNLESAMQNLKKNKMLSKTMAEEMVAEFKSQHK